MKSDTHIQHVTHADANIFLELGFEPDEAQRLQAISHRQINETSRLKVQLMGELARWITHNRLKQSEAARVLMVSRPRISDVVNQKTSKFTIDALVEMLARAGKMVQLHIG